MNELPKKKRSKAKSTKSIVEAMNKHLPASQQMTVPKAVRAKRKSKAVKIVELDRDTFGLIQDTAPRSAYGFVYQLTLTTALGTRYYVGSRHYDDAGAWKQYCTSSEVCQRLIGASRAFPEQVSIVWEILEQCPTSAMLKIRENVRMRGMYARVGKDRCINTADPFGTSLRTGKSLRR